MGSDGTGAESGSRDEWNPDQYLKGAMGDLRTRPAMDLLNRVLHDNPRTVVDLGCGPGNSTGLLRARWPGARVTGLDNSPNMLAKARAADPAIEWVEADIASWQPATAPDVIFTNAALHWVPDHANLFPRLAGFLAPGGVLAVQMPGNFNAPSHTLIAEVASDPAWAPALAGRLVGDFVQDTAFYHTLLRSTGGTPDVWETTYTQVLTGPDPVFEWVRGTALVPVREALDDAAFDAFCETYKAQLREAYPPADDGITLFPFRRLFITCTMT